MKPNIEHFKLPNEPGWKISVKLDVSPDEVHFIWDHGMEDLNIITWKGNDHPFSDFYDADKFHHTLWPQDGDVLSSYEARDFIRLLEIGFRQFEQFFMAENRKDPGYRTQWNFFDDNTRFEHAWIIGGQGSGKTTLLSALINEDLDKVTRGEASVIVIDSQNEHLGKYLPHLARFAPGGDLHGKLIYLTPDLRYPPKLNILDFAGYDTLDENEQFEMLDTVKDMLMFFIGALFGEASGHMHNIIDYAFRALLLIPDATVFTFKELLTKGGLGKLTVKYPALKELDEDTAEFLATRMFTQYAQTIGAVMTRLDGITRNKFTAKTFAQPENTLNLFEVLKTPHVIVVNTDKKFGDEATGTFGRFFLASLLRVVRRRVGGGLPVYVFADEAQQYIANDEAVIKLIAEARRQKIALTFAHHGMSDIKLDTVRAALHRAAIRAEPVNRLKHRWRVTINNGDSETILPPPVNFERMEQMPPDNWRAIVDAMQARFSPEPKKTTQPASKNISSHAIADEDATTDR